MCSDEQTRSIPRGAQNWVTIANRVSIPNRVTILTQVTTPTRVTIPKHRARMRKHTQSSKELKIG